MTGPVRSVSQAFAILRLLAATHPLSLSAIGREVGLSPSSALNLLKTLVAEGAVERDARTKSYRLTRDWTSLGLLRDDRERRLIDRALPLMQDFADAHDAAVGLWKIVSRDRMQLVARVESRAVLRLILAEAQRQPLGGGAVGRALAAAQDVDAQELARRHAPVRWTVDLPLDAYAAQVDEARRRGFAIDSGATHRGISTIAAALIDPAPGFCLSASIFSDADKAGEIDELGRRLVAMRDAISPRVAEMA